MNRITNLSLPLLAGLCVLFSQATLFAQEDPASDTKVIEETLNKIKDVGKLDQYITENNQLKNENKQLKAQIASLDKQVKKLTQELKVENERLRKQLVQLPVFQVKSKLVGSERSLAILQFSDRTIRIRQGIEMSVPVADGVWTLMKVLNISNDFIELEFPELEREVTLYD